MRFIGPSLLTLGLALNFGCGNSTSAPNNNGTDAGTTSAPTPLSDQITLNYGGLERSVILHIPPETPANAPLVIVMHGYSSAASAIAEYSGFKALADREKFIVAFPQGTIDASGYAFFNVGYDFHSSVTVDDIGFIEYLVATLQSDYSASAQLVFATGMSNGGDMSFYLACERSELFAAFAPVAGTMMKHIYDDCNPTTPRPMMAVNGTADDVTYYGGDLNNQDGWGVYLDMPTIVDLWRGLGGLELAETSSLPNSAPSDGSEVIKTRYYTEDHPRDFVLYRVEGGGHDWPGVWGNMDLNTTEEIWKFFTKVVDASNESR